MIETDLLLRREGGRNTIVRYDGSREYIKETAAEYLGRRCVMCGSTMKGRTEAVRQLTGWKQKIPVLISERTQEIWFPVISPDDPDCTWICCGRIVRVRESSPGCTCVIFDSGVQATVNAGVRTIRKQIRRCTSFIDLLNEYAVNNKPAAL